MTRQMTWENITESPVSVISKTSPQTYAEWCICLNYLKDNRYDHEIKKILSEGRLSWTSGVAERFSERLATIFNERLNEYAQRLSRTISHGYDEASLLTGLLATRRTLSFLYEIAILECFPQLLQKHLKDELERYANQTQSSLENSALVDRTGKLLSLIKHNSIKNYTDICGLSGDLKNNYKSNNDSIAVQSNQKFKKRNFL